MANTHSIDLEKDSSQYLSITDANQTGLDLTGDFTIEFWMKAETWGTGNSNGIIDKKYNDASNGYAIYNDGGESTKINARLNAQNNFFTSSAVTVGIWEHWAVVRSGSTGKWYKNGVLDNTGSVVSSDLSNSNGFYIGRSDSWEGHFDGLIDEVRIWNIARTETEIANNKDKELTGSESNLVGYWKLNNSLLDETSNNNDLTNNNSAIFSIDVPFVGASTSNFLQFF